MNPFEEYRITSQFGPRVNPIDGSSGEFHGGIDLVRYYQAPIYSFTDGIVIHAKEGVKGSGFGGYGNVVAVLRDDGRLICYCHLYCYLISVGTKVSKGSLIGRQGGKPGDPGAGSSTGSHLHLEVRKTSYPSYGWTADKSESCLDPILYLKSIEMEEVVEMSEVFKDVPKKHWATTSVEFVQEKGIMGGYPDGTFKGDQPITRYELAVALSRLYKEVIKDG